VEVGVVVSAARVPIMTFRVVAVIRGSQVTVVVLVRVTIFQAQVVIRRRVFRAKAVTPAIVHRAVSIYRLIRSITLLLEPSLLHPEPLPVQASGSLPTFPARASSGSQ
jgi:hypothetical protein